MVRCAVIGCSNRSERDKRVTYHRFPKETGREQAWVIAMRHKDWTPNKTSVVCSKHFEERCFIKSKANGQKAELLEEAIPTIFPTHMAVYNIKTQDAQVDDSVQNETPLEAYSHSSKNFKDLCHAAESGGEHYNEPAIIAELYEEAENKECYYNEAVNNVECYGGVETSVETFSVTQNAVQAFGGVETVIENIYEAKNATMNNFETDGDSSDRTVERFAQIYGIDAESAEEYKTALNENKQYRLQITTLQYKTQQLSKTISELEKKIDSCKARLLSYDDSETVETISELDNEHLTVQLAHQALPVMENFSSQRRIRM